MHGHVTRQFLKKYDMEPRQRDTRTYREYVEMIRASAYVHACRHTYIKYVRASKVII